jgi:hypothetical protein
MLSERDTIGVRGRGLPQAGASFAGRVLRDAVGIHPARQSRGEHLYSAVEWLKRAEAATPDGGVSYGYSIRGGWRPSYRETSGYIAVTFFELARQLQDSESATLARTISEWLCEVQEPDGSIANPRYQPDEGIVFDTGQVLLGYVRAYRETGETRFRDAAARAASWLASRLDDDGAWRRNTHLGTPHTYNTRVAWAMLEANDIAPDAVVQGAARKNLDWALGPEGIDAGTVRLVGTDAERIYSEVASLLSDDAAYEEMAQARNPYGDAHATEKILSVLAG